MTTWVLIRTMVQRGYKFEIGPHVDMRGYWACFYTESEDECDECGQSLHPAQYWTDVGHAMTPHLAVVMAAKIALNKPVQIPPLKDFI